MNTNYSTDKILAALFCVAVVIRLIAWWVVPEPILSTNATIAYLGGAQKLLEGDGFRDPTYPIFTPPLYAIVIALGSSVFGNDQIPIKSAQITVDGFTVILIYLITVQVFGKRVAIMSSAAWAIYPFAIYATLYIGSETLFTFLFSSFVLIMLHAFKSQKSHHYLLGGILLGLATQMRGTTQFLPLVLPVLLMVVERLSKRLMVNYLVLCLGFASILFPWGMRNYLVLGHFVPVANAGGVLLWGSADKFLTIAERDKELPRYYKELKSKGIAVPSTGSSLIEKDRFQFRAAVESYKAQSAENPAMLMWFLIRKIFRVWYATESGNGQGIIVGVNILIYLLAIWGMIVSWRDQNTSAMGLIGLIAYFVVLHSAALPLFRYMIPVMPFVLAFAVLGAARLQTRAAYHPVGVS